MLLLELDDYPALNLSKRYALRLSPSGEREPLGICPMLVEKRRSRIAFELWQKTLMHFEDI
jgi:hypothetical protein